MDDQADNMSLKDNYTMIGSFLNGSGVTEYDIYFHWAFYKVAVPVLYGFITFTGLVGNLLVVFVILSNKKMRNTVNLLLLNLAISDILFLTACVPFVAYHYAGDNWNLPEFLCKLWQFVQSVTVYVTVYTLVSVSVVRFLTIVYAHRTTSLRTDKNIILLIVAIWAIMFMVNIPILYAYRVKQFHFPPGYFYCGVDNGPAVNMTFFAFSYIIPLILISTFYLMLMRFLNINRKHSSLRHSNRSSSSEKRGRERTTFASRILLVVVAIFGISWFPLHLNLLWANYGQQPQTRAYAIFRVMCHCLAYANSCMNPIIYNYVSKDFRKRFNAIGSSCAIMFSKRGRNDSHVLNTYDYKNENATCNGGASSVYRGENTTRQSEARTSATTVGEDKLRKLSDDEPNIQDDHFRQMSPEKDGSSQERDSDIEMLYITKRRENGVPVTDL